MARRFGDFLGEFMVYETRLPSLGISRYMRIRVKLDVRLDLKRRKKVQVGDRSYYTQFQYEKLRIFFFICGKLGHREFLSDTNEGESIKNCLCLGCFLTCSSEKGIRVSKLMATPIRWNGHRGVK